MTTTAAGPRAGEASTRKVVLSTTAQLTSVAASASGGITVALGVTAGPYAYSPNITPIYSLNDDDYIVQESGVGSHNGVSPGGPALRSGASSVTGGFTDDPVHIVRSTPRVTGFVGSGQTPTPLSEDEVDAILNRVTTSADRPKPKVVFERNEQVRIVDGPFANFNGNVEEIDNDHSRLKVSVTIFGRSTPVELDFASVEKLG